MDTSLEVRVGEALRSKSLTVCSAESCTGGLVMHRLTNIAGSSAYVIGGIVAYSNQVKQALLNVKQGTLMAYGAVSEQTASEMALGARALLKTDIAVSITGIAGPDGGTAEKPVGLTYIGISAGEDILIVQRHVWPGDREAVKAASADAALQLILDTVSKL